MDEKQYLKLADTTFRTILAAFDDLDPDVVEADVAGDVITITFADREKCVVNTQRPTRQIWVAAESRGWHFRYDAERAQWLDDKGRNDELFATLKGVVSRKTGLALSLPDTVRNAG